MKPVYFFLGSIAARIIFGECNESSLKLEDGS